MLQVHPSIWIFPTNTSSTSPQMTPGMATFSSTFRPRSLGFTSSKTASLKVNTSWPLDKATLSKNPSTDCTSRNFTPERSHSTLGFFFIVHICRVFSLIFFPPCLMFDLPFVLLTNFSSISLPHWLC
jgi:hypothetical protein